VLEFIRVEDALEMIQSGDPELTDEITRWIDEIIPEQHNHGYAIEALIDGRHASVNLERQVTAIRCGCLQDMFLSALAHELATSERLDPSEFVGAYLPELNVGTEPGRLIRVADLLCQASGQHSPKPALAATWDGFTAYLTSTSARFPPGTVADHGFVERIILVRILTQILQSDPYTVILQRFFDGLDARALPSEHVGLLDLYTFPADLLKAVERLLAGAPEFLRAAISMPRPGTTWIFSPERVTKGFVPLATSFGLLSFGSGSWGQNGASSDGYVAVRFDETAQSIVVGFSAHRRLRDLTLNQVCHRLSSSSSYDPKSRIVGHLNGFLPEELIGTYDRGHGVVDVEYDGEMLSLDFRDNSGKAHCTVLPDGYLRTPFPMPSLWIEPFLHPSLGTTCIKIGAVPVVRLDSRR
jgi:hypothetical protein